MHKIIDAWDCTKRGDFILTLDEQLPQGFYKKCRIEGKEYSLVPVHIFGAAPEVLLKHIGLKATTQADFLGKEIEFI